MGRKGRSLDNVKFESGIAVSKENQTLSTDGWPYLVWGRYHKNIRNPFGLFELALWAPYKPPAIKCGIIKTIGIKRVCLIYM